MAQIPVDTAVCAFPQAALGATGGALGASLQYRATSCLCLWVELYESKGSLAMLCGGPELANMLTWADTYSGGGEVLVLLGQFRPTAGWGGVCFGETRAVFVCFLGVFLVPGE